MKTFNVATGMPELVVTEPHVRPVLYGPHARVAARTDRYGDLTRYLPRQLSLKAVQVVEASVVDDRISKLVVRYQVDFQLGLDLVLVIAPCKFDRRTLFVRTVWANESDDHHRTLRDVYDRPSSVTRMFV